MRNAVEHVGFLHPDWRDKFKNSSGLVNQDEYDMRGSENRGEETTPSYSYAKGVHATTRESNTSMAGEGDIRMIG